MNKSQRLVLIVSILASFVAFLDGSVINVALPAIIRDLGGGLAAQQWVVDAYLITLGSLILLAGSLSDLFGRARILAVGLAGFALTSLLCAVAPNDTFLILARALQGIAGALLVPSSLALIIASFSGPAQGKAIGSWTAWTGIAFIVGPLIGGVLVDAASWRWIFVINLLPIALTLWLLRLMKNPEPRERTVKVDTVGAVLCTIGLAGAVLALIEQPRYGWGDGRIAILLVFSIIMLACFIWYEHRTRAPMLPLKLFNIRNFSVGNVATTAIYAGLSIATFTIVIFLQQVGQYSALAAGLALLPVTIMMFFLSSRFGRLAGVYGPRLFMAAGPLVAAAGFLLLLRVNETVSYWPQLFPGILVFGLGLSVTVAPLTAAILGSIDSRNAGIASAVNNAVARIAGLVAIAAVGVIVGQELDVAGFHRVVWTMAGLLAIGGTISAIGIHNSPRAPATVSPITP